MPLKFQREGIKYDELSEEEKEQWDALEWDEDGSVPDRVEAEAVNKWLFNKDTVDKVLEHLMTRGLTVAGGDRLGKTIVFAKNQDHAEFIAERFDANYPHYKGEFARVITFKTEYAQSLIDNFSNKDKAPHIAISVDMLDTGIDIPEVVNLVFFKLVRSKTKFWQMVGRGTRLCPDLFGPGKDKEFFYLFDYCQNLEFFSQNPDDDRGRAGRVARQAAVQDAAGADRRAGPAAPADAAPAVAEQQPPYGDPPTRRRQRARGPSLQLLHARSRGDEPRQLRRAARSAALVEKYAKPEAWAALSAEALAELAHEVAGLPSELDPEDEEAKRFDLLMLNLQLARAARRSRASSGCAIRSRRSPGCWRRRPPFRWCASRWR